MCLPYCIGSCMYPRMSERAQDISASSRTTNTRLSLPKYGFCHSRLFPTSDPSPWPMKILNCSCMLYVSMCTLKLQPCLQAQVLHVQLLDWGSREDVLGRTCVWCTCSGKWNPPDTIFHSAHPIFICKNTKLDEKTSIATPNQKDKTTETNFFFWYETNQTKLDKSTFLH